MVAEEHNLILEHLRAIRRDMGSLREAIQEIKTRLISIETTQAATETRLAQLHADQVGHAHQLYRVSERLERIERRLDLHEPPPHGPIPSYPSN